MSIANATHRSARQRRESEALDLLASHPLLGMLPPLVHTRLLREATLLYLGPRETLYRAGEPAQTVFAVCSGAFQIEYPRPRQQAGFVAAMLAAPAWVGECQVLHGRTWSGTGVALTSLTALAIGRPLFESLLLEHPHFAFAAYSELTQRFLGAIETWKHQQKAEPPLLLARYLLSYARVLELAGARLGGEVKLRQSDVASATGLRRETVNRLLRTWGKKGWVRFDRDGLQAISARHLLAMLPEKHPAPLLQTLELGTLPQKVKGAPRLLERPLLRGIEDSNL